MLEKQKKLTPKEIAELSGSMIPDYLLRINVPKQKKLTPEEIGQIAESMGMGAGYISREKEKKEIVIDYDAFTKAEEIKSRLDEQIKKTGNIYRPFDFSGMTDSEKEIVFQGCVDAGNNYLKSLKQKPKPVNYNPITAIERAYKMYKKAGYFCSDSGKKRILVKSVGILENILKKHREKGKTTLSLSIASFILALFFSALNFTGAVVSSAQQDFSILGILFFICGLVGSFIYVRSKR
jgi:hypothetical protein